jgi:HK97 family phage prohead protease
MKIKRRQFGFEVKAIDEKGAFSGYGSIFGNTDAYRDVVMPGAFAGTLADWQTRDALPPILWQHNSDQPIGPFTAMAEDGKGLYVEGQLLIKDVQQAREAYALVKSKTIRGMSIGYNVLEEEYDAKTNVNRVTAVDLWEVSLVTFPANIGATVSQIKSILEAGELPSLAIFERFLRDEGGFSQNVAKKIAGYGLRDLLKQRDADEGQLDETRVESMLALFNEPMKL